jgi:putative radical SAM enzyme (TIGR03279 family)
MAVCGITVKRVYQGSVAHASGVQRGDRIVAANGERVDDELDFMFMAAVQLLELEIVRRGATRLVSVVREEGEFLGLEFASKPLRRCRNRCIFCFIDQMPPGLRKTLYIKDEDYRHSFVYGNYVTLSSVSDEELLRIASLGYSPQYVSVHATDAQVRAKMLGNRRAPPIMQQLKLLQRAGVCFHTQIVICPGHNDGEVLKRSIRDLLSLKKGLLSVALVPVGVTRFRSGLATVDEALARQICEYAMELSDKDSEVMGVRRLYCADELFIKANMALPPARYYAGYPQIENGIGLVRQILDEGQALHRKLKRGSKPTTQPFIDKGIVGIVTSLSALAFIQKLAAKLQPLLPNHELRVVGVENRFLGSTVTVAGLLTARDVVHELRSRSGEFDAAIVPGVMFNHNGVTLDGMSAERMQRLAALPLSSARRWTDVISLLTGIHYE